MCDETKKHICHLLPEFYTHTTRTQSNWKSKSAYIMYFTTLNLSKNVRSSKRVSVV